MVELDLERIIGASPDWATELTNMCKCTEEMGELAECIFKGFDKEARVEEIADVLLSVVMDMRWCGATEEELIAALEKKITRQEKRVANETDTE
jgi:NTP pyrophosphatase (non-canonical NTP hydrolase)